jgi:hypothetical protein
MPSHYRIYAPPRVLYARFHVLLLAIDRQQLPTKQKIGFNWRLLKAVRTGSGREIR